MIWTVSSRRSPSRRRSAPLTTKRSCSRSVLRRSVGGGQSGSGLASAARERSNGNGGRSSGADGSRRTPEQPALLRRGQERQLLGAQQVVHRQRDEHGLAAAAQAGHRKPERAVANQVGEFLKPALEAGRRGQAGQIPKAGPGEPAGHQGPPLPASSARQTSRPSSRLLRNRRRQEAGSSRSRVATCQAKCKATAASSR